MPGKNQAIGRKSFILMGLCLFFRVVALDQDSSAEGCWQARPLLLGIQSWDWFNQNNWRTCTQGWRGRDFPGGPVAKTLHSECRELEFDPWSGN